MGLLDNLLKRKPKEIMVEMKPVKIETETIVAPTPPTDNATQKLDLSKKIGLNFSKLNLDKKDVRDKTIFMLDISGSMDDKINKVRKIDSLRDVMDKYSDARKVCFSTSVGHCPKIPEPNGSTNLARALRFVKSITSTPERIVLVSDGEPDSETDAKKVAVELGIPIDIIFIGEKGSSGQKFMEELAEITHGEHFVV